MSARAIVTTRIALQARKYPDLDISPLETGDLDDREASLAHAINHAVLSRWLTLVRVVESQLTRPWAEVEHKLQAVLLVGAAQLLLLDRLPDHAVINEAVEWAKNNIRPKAGGMVNAVLRKVAGLRGSEKLCQEYFPDGLSRAEMPLGDGRVRVFNAEVFDADPMRRLAQQSSHPEALIHRWLATFGPETTTRIALHDLAHPPIIFHGFDTDQAEANHLPRHSEPGCTIFSGDRNAFQEFLQTNPKVIVQDPAAAVPGILASMLQPQSRTIIDVCAGKGTKTRQLVQLIPEARVICTDIDADRLAILREQFRDHDRVQVIEHGELRRFDGQAELLLLDVPCSNSGVLARRIEAKYRFSKDSVLELVDLQRQIVADSIPLLAPRGRILYSTCSIEPAENQQQAQWIAKWHRMRIVQSKTTIPNGLPGEDPAVYRDGGYGAVLERDE